MKQSKPIKMYVIRLTREDVATILNSIHVQARAAAIRADADETLRLMELKEKILKQASKSEDRG